MKSSIQYLFCISALCLLLNLAAFGQTTTQSQKFGANPTSIAPSAVLEVESANKGVLFPRIALTSTADVSTIASPATGLTIFNTASAGTSPNAVSPGYYYWNGTKWVKLAVETPFAKTVYVNANSPSTATLFDENNPPATNDNGLKANDNNLYIGLDGSTWTYDPTGAGSYKTFAVAPSTPFNLANTTTDAGSNKTGAIGRTGRVGIGTNSPSNSLDVLGGITVRSVTGNMPVGYGIEMNTNSNSPRLDIVFNGAYTGQFSSDANDFLYKNSKPTTGGHRFFTKPDVPSAATEKLVILNNGNVGIGTPSPTSILDVRHLNTTAFQPTIIASSNPSALAATGFNATDPSITKASSGIQFLGWAGAKEGGIFRQTGSTSKSHMLFTVNNTNDVAMVINENRNVGIGMDIGLDPYTTRHKLTVRGLDAQPSAQGTRPSNAIFRVDGNTQHSLDFGTFTNSPYGAYIQVQNKQNTDGLPLILNPTGGRVGIGVLSPISMLDIQHQTPAANTINADAKVLRLSRPSITNTRWNTVAEFNLGSYATVAGGASTEARTRLDLSLNDGNSLTVSQVMTWQANGRVGINKTDPAYALDVTGDINASETVRAKGVTLTSDLRLKSNIVNLSSALSKIMQLRPVNYDKKFALDSEATSNEHGFIAQELQKVMPELVSEGKDKDKLLSVNYVAIIPVLTKAIQEQQKIIEQNQSTIQKQQAQIDELRDMLLKLLNDN